MTPRSGQPKIVVLGLERWELTKLVRVIADAAAFNHERGYKTLGDCPAAWRAYCDVLQREWVRRGSPERLF
jgi:hypothetical protein